MRPAIVLFVLVGAGCASTAPEPVAAPPAVVTAVEPPASAPILVEPEPVEPAPVVPPPVLERRIDRRAVYEQAGAVEWTLANGLTVVYVQEPEAEAYRAAVRAPGGWASLPPAAADRFVGAQGSWGALAARVEPDRREAVGEAEGLATLVADVAALFSDPPSVVVAPDPLDALAPRRGRDRVPAFDPDAARQALADAFDRPSDFRVFLSGSVGREWVEPLVAERLAVAGRGARFGPLLETPPAVRAESTTSGPAAGTVFEADVAAGWDDLPAVLTLERALADRVGTDASVSLRLDAAAGRARLRIASAGAASLLDPLDADALRRARDAAARDAAGPAGRLRAFATLYEVPGRFRPALRPDQAARLADAIERTPPARVADLLRRLAASPDAATVTVLPQPSDAP
ncbi:hypothetical protein [Rubrivirga sp.]|uniref:hypothetical protein n=1 Tax=Rubrivirga sp. TaxID=1885344 RepID=UPI003B52BC9F